MPVALEALSDELFEQVLCLLIVIGFIAYCLVKAARGQDPGE